MYNCSYTHSRYYIFIMYQKKAETHVQLLIHMSQVLYIYYVSKEKQKCVYKQSYTHLRHYIFIMYIKKRQKRMYNWSYTRLRHYIFIIYQKKSRNTCTIARTRVSGIIYLLCIKRKAETRVRLLVHASRVIKDENRKRNTRTSNCTCISRGCWWPPIARYGCWRLDTVCWWVEMGAGGSIRGTGG